MNPLFESQVQQVRATIAELKAGVERLQNQLSKSKAEHAQLRQENWRWQREATTAQHAVEDYEALETRCERYAERQEEVRKRLLELQVLVRALSEEESP